MEVRMHNQLIARSMYELSLTVTVVHLIGRVAYTDWVLYPISRFGLSQTRYDPLRCARYNRLPNCQVIGQYL